MREKIFISFSEAQRIILKKVKAGSSMIINPADAAGYVLANEVRAYCDTPPFNNSAMDGYAFRFSDLISGKTIRITGEVQAGKPLLPTIKSGEAIRIFTGAPIPKGADTVVMQEKVKVNGTMLEIIDAGLKKGGSVRLKGSQSKKGVVILRKNKPISAAAIGLLASTGVNKITVYKKPVVSIIVTGNELTEPGKTLKPGQIYESNEVVLHAVLRNEGIDTIRTYKVKDEPASIKKAFSNALKSSDLILFTGGISVGDYDFTGTVLKETQVRTGFYKVRQKPGKPLYFGMKNNCVIFGLPGNPASVLTCYFEYVLPAIRKMQNHPDIFLSRLSLPVTAEVTKKSGLTVFFKAFTDFKKVTVLKNQESYKMNSFAEANCFVVLDEETIRLKKNAEADVHLFNA